MYPNEGRTQGNCTQTNLKRHLTLIKTTNRMGSSLRTQAHAHATNKTEGLSHWLQRKSSQQRPSPKMSSSCDAVRKTFSLLCAQIVF